MKNRIATIAFLFCAITLTGCTCYGDRTAMVSVAGPMPAGYAISDLPSRPYESEVAGNLISNYFND